MSEDAVVVKSEINTIFGRCRCCLDYGYMKNMWVEHYTSAEPEVYGEMLKETFSIAWDDSGKAYICDTCIEKLRVAFNFKKELLAVEEKGMEDSDEYEMEENNQDWLNYETEEAAFTEDDTAPEIKTEPNDVEEYEQVEFLDEYLDEMGQDVSVPAEPKQAQSAGSERQTRSRTSGYKKYTTVDMRKAIEAVIDNQMTIAEAAKEYNVPRKTLTAKVYNLKNGKPESEKSQERQQIQDKQYNFVEEVKKILSITTAVPFKIKASQYYCAICYTNIESFQHPSDLRAHTSLHEDEMEIAIERILRPQFLNEILRVDIRDFHCKDCSIPIETWNDMFIHLSEVHNIELDEVYNRLIPYKLVSDCKVFCGLCSADFPNLQYLDAHMNAHYCNYVCPECGDTFVSEKRLKQHELSHNTGRYPCKHCGKVFSLEKYKQKHEAMVHAEFKMFRCNDCGEKFVKEYEKHLHVMKNHPDRIRTYTCEFCGKTFDWKPYYLAHLRKAHSTVKKNVCRYCKKRFVTKYEVKTHEMRHTGKGKFLCFVCGKNFVTPVELKNHSKKHEKEAQNICQRKDNEVS